MPIPTPAVPFPATGSSRGRGRGRGLRWLIAVAAVALASTAAANPATAPLIAAPVHVVAIPAAPTSRPQPALTTEPSSTPLTAPADARATPYHTGLVATTVGQLGGADGGCAATVVSSASGRVALTAAHCVYTPEAEVFFPRDADHGHQPGWKTINTFVPGRDRAKAPNGVWPIEKMWVDPRWQSNGDPTYDIAALRISALSGRTPQQVLGAQGLSFGGASGKPVTTLGYPAVGRFDGTTLQRCTAIAAVPVAGSGGEVMMPCDMNEGASGGPWLTDFDPATGRGLVTAITSYMNHDGPATLYARPLDDTAYRLYLAADGQQ